MKYLVLLLLLMTSCTTSNNIPLREVPTSREDSIALGYLVSINKSQLNKGYKYNK